MKNMKKKKDLHGAQMTHLASFVPVFIVAAQLLLLSFVVIHIGYSLIERKKGKKKRHKHGGGEDRPTIVSVIGTTGRISFDRINDVIKAY
jgi:hypothetical protein